MAEGLVRIVINAVDKYSGVLTGLNQGLELVGKGFSFVTNVSGKFFDALGSGLDLAVKGGNFAEINAQLNNVAKSFNISSKSVVDSLDDITQNMLKLPELAMLAGRGITAGLDETQLEKVFTFVKRRTEVTGESFTAMSEQIFSALQSGRFATIKQMGLLVEKGDDVASIMRKIEDATKKYGDAGFNAADKVAALSAQADNFTTKIGVAINDTPRFQAILTKLTDTVVDFVQEFDTAPVTRFFDYVLRVAESTFNAFAQNFPGISAIFDNLFGGGTDSAKSFTRNVVSLIFQLVTASAKVVNQIIDVIQAANFGDNIGEIISIIIRTVTFGASKLLQIINSIDRFFVSGIQKIIETIASIAENNPSIAELIGINPEDLREVQASLEKQTEFFNSTTEKISKSLEQIGLSSSDVFEDMNKNLEGWKIDLGDIAKGQKEITDSIDTISYEKPIASAIKSFEAVKPAVEATTEAISNAVKKSALSAKDTISALENALTDIEKRLNRGTVVEGGRFFTGLEREAMLKEAEELRDKIKKAIGGDLSITADVGKGTGLEEEIKSYLASVNWPSEFRAMGEFLLNFVLQKARGERVPFALITQ